MSLTEILNWLLAGDVSIQYQVHRDLLSSPEKTLTALRSRISLEGWGAEFLAAQQPEGHWGRGFYMPKWTSTHYTLLDLRLLEMPSECPQAKQAIDQVLSKFVARDGGVDPTCQKRPSDVCINGMFLNYASHFETEASKLMTIVDFILSQKMPDGGFNCNLNQKGAVHSSLHTTLSVLEGIQIYSEKGYAYRLEALEPCRKTAHAFLLTHELYKSDKTGETIHPNMLVMKFPPRWHYDVYRALDYLRTAEKSGHFTMDAAAKTALLPAIEALKSLRKKDGRWTLPSKYPGEVHFDMEKAGLPSRINTLRALRILQWYENV